MRTAKVLRVPLAGAVLAILACCLPAGPARVAGQPSQAVRHPQSELVKVLRWLRPADHPVITIAG